MGRPLRIEYPGALYHITNRGNERQNIFKDKEDKIRFLKIIGETQKKFYPIIYAYVWRVSKDMNIEWVSGLDIEHMT